MLTGDQPVDDGAARTMATGGTAAVEFDGTVWRLLNEALVLTFDTHAVRFAIGPRDAPAEELLPFSPFDLAIDGDRVDYRRLTTESVQPIQDGGNAELTVRLVGQQPAVRIEAQITAEANGGPLHWRTAVSPGSDQPITVTMLRSLRPTIPNRRNDWQWWTLSGGRRTAIGLEVFVIDDG